MRNRRHTKLVRPVLQLQFGLVFGAVALASILVSVLVQNMAETSSDPSGFRALLSAGMVKHVLLSAGMVVPVALGLGALSVYRVLGPLYRVERDITLFLGGQDDIVCRFREGDQPAGLDDLVNQLFDRVRAADQRGASVIETSVESAPSLVHGEEHVTSSADPSLN